METKLASLKGCDNDNNVIISSVPYSIGRCRTANFIIAHVNVSRNHCQIVKEDGSWKINDFSSSGTFINGKLVGKGKSAVLNSGDNIRFGPVESNLCWSFHLSTPLFEDEINLSLKSQPERILEISKDKSHSEEKTFSNALINVNIKSEINSNGEQKLKQNDDLKPEDAVGEVLIKNEKQTVTENKVIEDFAVKENSCTIKEENNESKKIQELTKELQQIQSALNDLEKKNKKLAEEAKNNNETSASSNLVENLTDLLETELQCTICSELFVIAVTLSCTHTFCKYCINLWKKKQKTCPICRKKITNETRSLVVDNYIDKMVENLSPDLKSKRQAIIKERSEIEPVKKKAKVKK